MRCLDGRGTLSSLQHLGSAWLGLKPGREFWFGLALIAGAQTALTGEDLFLPGRWGYPQPAFRYPFRRARLS